MRSRVRAVDRFGGDLFVASAQAMATARWTIVRSLEARLAAREAQQQTADRRARMSRPRATRGTSRLAAVVDLAAVRASRRN